MYKPLCEYYYHHTDKPFHLLCVEIYLQFLMRQNTVVGVSVASAYSVLCYLLVQQDRSSEVMVKYDNEF